AAPAIGDLDGNQTLEIVVPGDVYNCGIGDPAGDLYYLPWILNLDRTRWSAGSFNWTVLPAPSPGSGPKSQNYEVIENSVTNAVLADLDSDGRKEIIYAAYDGRVHAYWLDKTQHGSWPFAVPGAGIRFASEPAVVDLNNDGAAEVIIASWPEKGGNRRGQLHIVSASGVQLHAVDLPAPALGSTWNGGLGAPTVANIDADPELEIVVGTSHSGVVAYDVPGSANARMLWPTGRGSYERTGEAGGTPFALLSARQLTQRIQPGQTATYALDVPAEASVAISAVVPADLSYDLQPGTVSGPGQTLLSVTDTRGEPRAPGQWYSPTVTATAAGRTQTITLRLLVDGSSLALPVVRR
ncbi:MAG TPA: VCBS repeat-containing protein, partial [Herpetosiphonaceae bacterium]